MHSDGNYLSGSNCIPLAQRGYRALCMNSQFTNNADNNEGFYQIAPAIGAVLAISAVSWEPMVKSASWAIVWAAH